MVGAQVTYPTFIVCRDRLTPLLGLLGWLEDVGHAGEVYLLDNNSSYPPLLDYYATTEHTVIHTGGNHGHKVGWTHGHIRRLALGRRFVYSDPDLLPTQDCPPDAIERMAAVLDHDSQTVKCGFGLKIDDLPDWCRDGIVAWESPFWQKWNPHVKAWRAPIDTTFALHAAGRHHRFAYKPAYRLPDPYLMRHLPWYVDPENLDAEEAYYVAHADHQFSNYARYVMESA